MKNKSLILTTLFAALILSSFTIPKLHTDNYTVDVKQSTLEWYAEKVTGKHNGTILLSGGEIKNNHGQLSASFEINMSSIADKDIEDAGKRANLEKHLKSPDFFDVAKYPLSKFVLTSITPVTDKPGFSHHVKGNLTIKDKTNEIAFDAAIVILPDKITCSGSAIVDRSKFDVRYGSKTFFEDIGDKMIYDDFTLKFNVIAARQ